MRYLYRGFYKGVQEGVYENKFIHKRRTPIDTPAEIHDFADKWFFEKFGIYARSRTIFCSTDLVQAREYGRVARITPIGDAVYIYSPQVIDFVEILYPPIPNSFFTVSDWLEEKCYNAVNDVNEIDEEFKGEVMLACNSFNVSFE